MPDSEAHISKHQAVISNVLIDAQGWQDDRY